MYSWERQDSPTVSSGHLRVYQLASLKAIDFGVTNLSIVGKFGYSTDISTEALNDPRLRVVNLYLKYKVNKNNIFYLGRQRIYSGAVTVAYDGFRFSSKSITNLNIEGYWGTNVPNDRGIEVLAVKENQVLGVKLSYRHFMGFNFSLSYSDIRRLPAAYTDFGKFTGKKLERQATQERLLGANLQRKFADKFNLYSRILLNYAAPVIGSGKPGFRHFQKFELRGKYTHSSNISFTTEYLIRRPRLNENSIFWVFNQRSFSEFGGKIHYRIDPRISFYAGLSLVKYDKKLSFEGLEDSSLRLNAGMNMRGFSLFLSGRSGYAGESKSGGFSYAASLSKRNNVRAGVNYNRYKINSDADEDNNSKSAFIGITHRINSRIWGDFDIRFLSQDITSQRDFFGYSSDVRFFARVNYSFRAKRN